MNKSEIEELISLMENSSLSELEIEDGNFRISLRKPDPILSSASASILSAPSVSSVSLPPVVSTCTDAVTDCASAEPAADNCYIIKSPMVGTFYCAPSPDSDPFVHVGSKVDKDTVVCIKRRVVTCDKEKYDNNTDAFKKLFADMD